MAISSPNANFLAPSKVTQQQWKHRLLKISENYVAYPHKRPEAVYLTLFVRTFLIKIFILIYILKFLSDCISENLFLTVQNSLLNVDRRIFHARLVPLVTYVLVSNMISLKK